MSEVVRLEGPVNLDLDAVSGMPYTIHNLVLADRLSALPEPYAEEPCWNAEEATDRAEALLKEIRGELPKALHHSKAEFVRKGSYRNSWHVVWSTTHQGHEIHRGWMDIYLNEEFGLVMYRGGYVIPPPTTEVKISKEAAIAKTMELHQLLQNTHNDFIEASVHAAATEARLLIVNPNYHYTPFREGDKTIWGKDPRNESRLAWAIHRRLPTKAGSSIGQETWIDAETGEVLGGSLD